MDEQKQICMKFTSNRLFSEKIFGATKTKNPSLSFLIILNVSRFIFRGERFAKNVLIMQ